MKKTLTKQIREWLNPIESHHSGWLKFEISSDSNEVYCNLNIGDCNRQININLSCEENGYEASFEQGKEKFDLLINSLQEIRDIYEDYYDFHIEQKKLEKE